MGEPTLRKGSWAPDTISLRGGSALEATRAAPLHRARTWCFMAGAHPCSVCPGMILLLGTDRMWGCGVGRKQVPPNHEGNTTKEAADGAAAQGWGRSSSLTCWGGGAALPLGNRRGRPPTGEAPGPRGQLGGMEAQEGCKTETPASGLRVQRALAGNQSEV